MVFGSCPGVVGAEPGAGVAAEHAAEGRLGEREAAVLAEHEGADAGAVAPELEASPGEQAEVGGELEVPLAGGLVGGREAGGDEVGPEQEPLGLGVDEGAQAVA